jgi:hypothetical protein
MSQEEYQSFARTSPPHSFEPRIEEVADDVDGAYTVPPSARRSESLARMHMYGTATPQPRRSDPAGAYGLDVPRAPLVPMLTIPAPESHTSSPERVAVSTDRPTALAAQVDLADRTRVLRHAMTDARVAELALDHRAGFMLSLIDGTASIEEVLDMCPMPELEALSVLANLLRRGVIALRPLGVAGRAAR